MAAIYTESITIRNKSTDARETGLTLWLLPEGGTAPDDCIQLTENANMSGQYDFPTQVTNGNYVLYSGPSGAQVPVQHGSQQVEVRVIRDGIVKAEDTDFAYP